MSAFKKKGELGFKLFIKAQKWSSKNKPSKRAIKLLSDVVAEKKLLGVQSILRESGHEDFLLQVQKKFGRVNPVNNQCLIAAEVWRGIADPTLVPKCAHCNDAMDRINIVYCSTACLKASDKYERAGQSISKGRQAESKEKRQTRQDAIEATNLRRRGVRFSTQDSEVSQRIRDTHAARTQDQKQKTVRKGLETFAARNDLDIVPDNVMDVPSIRRKHTRSVREAYANSNEEIQALRVTRSLEAHGVRHHIHREEVRDKINRFRRKTVTLGGTDYQCQGYEDVILKRLHQNGYALTTKCEGIDYAKADGSKHRYYPDLYAKNGDRRLIVEVKSIYTFDWTRKHCPEKFFAGTTWGKKKRADYLVVIVVPGKYMTLFKNPKSLRDLKKTQGTKINLD